MDWLTPLRAAVDSQRRGQYSSTAATTAAAESFNNGRTGAATNSTFAFVETGGRRGEQDSQESSQLLGKRVSKNDGKQTKSQFSEEGHQVLPEGKFIGKKCEVPDS